MLLLCISQQNYTFCYSMQVVFLFHFFQDLIYDFLIANHWSKSSKFSSSSCTCCMKLEKSFSDSLKTCAILFNVFVIIFICLHNTPRWELVAIPNRVEPNSPTKPRIVSFVFRNVAMELCLQLFETFEKYLDLNV